MPPVNRINDLKSGRGRSGSPAPSDRSRSPEMRSRTRSGSNNAASSSSRNHSRSRTDNASSSRNRTMRGGVPEDMRTNTVRSTTAQSIRSNSSNRSNNSNNNPSDAFFDQIEMIRNEMKAVSEMIKEIEKLHRRALTSLYADEASRISADIEEIMEDISVKSNKLRKVLKDIGDQNQELANKKTNGNADLRLRTNQVTQLSKKFMSIMSEYQEMQDSYRARYGEQLKRQYKLARPDATEDELNAITNADGATLMAKQVFLGNSEDARKLLDEISDRHEDIMMMEKSVVELHQLFMDLALLIEQQGNMVSSIEQQVEQASEYTANAVVELKQAVVTQKKSRKKRICLITVCFVLLLVLGLVLFIYWKQLFPSSAPVSSTTTPKNGTTT